MSLPTSIRFAKQTFAVIRAIDTSERTHPNIMKSNTSFPIPNDDWQEQEIRLIHTADYTWSIPSNKLFTQQVVKTWTTKDKKWHISLIQKHPIPFIYPQLTTKDILFSEKERRKVGKSNGILWFHSEKGFRYVIKSNDEYQTMLKTKMLD